MHFCHDCGPCFKFVSWWLLQVKTGSEAFSVLLLVCLLPHWDTDSSPAPSLLLDYLLLFKRINRPWRATRLLAHSWASVRTAGKNVYSLVNDHLDGELY